MRGVRLAAAVAALLLVPTAVRPGPQPAAPPAGPLAVSAALEPAEIRVGDAALLTVTVEHPAAGSVELPPLDEGRSVVVTERARTTAPLGDGKGGGRERTTFVVGLTSFAVGEHRIGAGAVRWTDRGGVTAEAPFPAAVLRTRSVLRGEGTPMRGIKGLARWPAPPRRWVAHAAALLLLAAAAVLGMRRLARGRRPAPAPAPPPPGPHETALRELAALKRRRPTGAEAIEPWYRELSAVVRRYVEGRFGLRAPELTTEESIREAAGSGLLDPAHQALVRTFLEQCDLVKFARHLPDADGITSAFEAAGRLVRETKPPAAGAARP